jgi:integrase
MLDALGADVRMWTPQAVRQFLLASAVGGRSESTQKLITATRAFLRYLAFRGSVHADLGLAVPAVAHWRLASLPHHLTADELMRVLAACDGVQPARIRDRAIVLLLARLGLRAGDVAQLRLTDLDWEQGTLQVTGKGRYQVRLPLPQEVGDAVLRYLATRPRVPETDRVFLTMIAPVSPLRSSDAVSSVVARTFQRAGIQIARPGAHVLRHTAATEMLRHGVSLDHIGLVLRHRSLDMSAYYAKVDVDALRQVAQPWPGRQS